MSTRPRAWYWANCTVEIKNESDASRDGLKDTLSNGKGIIMGTLVDSYGDVLL